METRRPAGDILCLNEVVVVVLVVPRVVRHDVDVGQDQGKVVHVSLHAAVIVSLRAVQDLATVVFIAGIVVIVLIACNTNCYVGLYLVWHRTS